MPFGDDARESGDDLPEAAPGAPAPEHVDAGMVDGPGEAAAESEPPAPVAQPDVEARLGTGDAALLEREDNVAANEIGELGPAPAAKLRVALEAAVERVRAHQDRARPAVQAASLDGVRAIWNGHVRLGLVTIPVSLAVARSRRDPVLRRLHRPCGNPIAQPQTCPEHGEITDAEELVRGFEFSPGQFALVEADELETLDSREVEIRRFVPAGAVPRLHVDHPWWLQPAADPVGQRPYKLLLEAMREEHVDAIAHAVLFGREHATLIRADEELLTLETLYLASELRAPDVAGDVDRAQLQPTELQLARRLVRAMGRGRFRPGDLDQERGRKLEALLEAKIQGRHVARPARQPAPPVDLTEALRQSLQQAQKKRPSRREATLRPRARRAATASR